MFILSQNKEKLYKKMQGKNGGLNEVEMGETLHNCSRLTLRRSF